MTAVRDTNDTRAPIDLDHRLLTPAQVAELFQVPRSTVYGLAREGRLPCLRIGRAIRFSQEDLERYLSANHGVRQ
jgi:excisionase family DNA binding protein